MLNRRSFVFALTGSLLSAGTLAQKAPDYSCAKPDVPTDWCAAEMYNEYATNGVGVATPGPADRPVAYIAFDSQCGYCMRLMDQASLLADKINFIWMPVAVLNTKSEPQGAAILSAKDRFALMEKHHAQFANKPIKGLNPKRHVVASDMRDAVWVNTKIFRKSGARVVPFGVMKDKNDNYHAILYTMKAPDIAKLFGVDF